MEDMSFDFAQKHDNEGRLLPSEGRRISGHGNLLAKGLASWPMPSRLKRSKSPSLRSSGRKPMARWRWRPRKKLGTLSAEREAEGYLLSIQQGLKGEERFRMLRTSRRWRAVAQAKEQADANQMRTLMKKIVEESSTFDKKGDPDRRENAKRTLRTSPRTWPALRSWPLAPATGTCRRHQLHGIPHEDDGQHEGCHLRRADR